MFLDAYALGRVDINEPLMSFVDDIAGLYQIGEGSNITEMPVEIRCLARPMAILRLVRMYQLETAPHLPLFIKTHVPHLVANGIELLPSSLTKAVVHIVRDPRDVLPSFAKHMGADMDSALKWMQDDYRHLKGNYGRVGELISSWERHTRSYLNADTHNVKTFWFEDLRADPVKVFSDILRHAGVEPDARRVEKAVELTQLDRLRDDEKSVGFKEASPHAKGEFFGKGQVGGWRRTLTHKQRYGIEKACGRLMKRLGYLNKRRAA